MRLFSSARWTCPSSRP
ncbi:hypothetical protein ACHAWF_001145 [Thalassiosira exigua]